MTFHQAMNYGAVLQAYALYKTVSKKGHFCEVIDYRNHELSRAYHVRRLREIKNLRQFASYCRYHSILTKKARIFVRFLDETMKISMVTYDKKTINETNNIYDIFIVGSDQVWNLELTGGDFTYYLDFVEDKSKKNAYAACFGMEGIPERYQDKVRNALGEFKNISVRETEGKRMITDLQDTMNVTVSLDPSLLLNGDEWRSIAGGREQLDLPKKYILLYLISPTEENYIFAKSLSKQTGLKVVYINNYPKKAKGVINLMTVTPEQFVSLIDGADYLVTNSFHGTAFAINLGTEFFYELRRDKPGKNSRILNLVTQLGLTGREIVNHENSHIDREIDWLQVYRKLDLLRKSSLEYIDVVLK